MFDKRYNWKCRWWLATWTTQRPQRRPWEMVGFTLEMWSGDFLLVGKYDQPGGLMRTSGWAQLQVNLNVVAFWQTDKFLEKYTTYGCFYLLSQVRRGWLFLCRWPIERADQGERSPGEIFLWLLLFIFGHHVIGNHRWPLLNWKTLCEVWMEWPTVPFLVFHIPGQARCLILG